MDSLERARGKILEVISGSPVPEDYRHAENTLLWLLHLNPQADEALKIAALGHDIERALLDEKVRREDYPDYDRFKQAHAENSARIIGRILDDCGVEESLCDDIRRLVERHETGGDPRSDLLKEADAISFFDVNLPEYHHRMGRKESLRRCLWGWKRLSPRGKDIVAGLRFPDERIRALVREAAGMLP